MRAYKAGATDYDKLLAPNIHLNPLSFTHLNRCNGYASAVYLFRRPLPQRTCWHSDHQLITRDIPNHDRTKPCRSAAAHFTFFLTIAHDAMSAPSPIVRPPHKIERAIIRQWRPMDPLWAIQS